MEDVTERRKILESIKWLAQHDALTEIANPMYFGEELENALRQMQLGITLPCIGLISTGIARE